MPLTKEEFQTLQNCLDFDLDQGVINVLNGMRQSEDTLATSSTGDLEVISQHAASHPSFSVNALKVTKFWPKRPRAWFAQLEAEFLNHRPKIKDDKSKYFHLLSTLDHDTLDKVAEVVERPYSEGHYDILKQALMDLYDRSQFDRDLELLSLDSLEDRKPSQHLQLIEDLFRDPDSLKKTIFMKALPREIKIFASESQLPLKEVARCCDRMLLSSKSSEGLKTVYEIDGDYLDQDVYSVKKKMSFSHDKQFTKNRGGSLCWYHSRYGKNARACEPTCIMYKGKTEKKMQQGNAQAAKKSQW